MLYQVGFLSSPLSSCSACPPCSYAVNIEGFSLFIEALLYKVLAPWHLPQPAR